MHVEKLHRSPACTVRVIDANRHEPLSPRIDESGPAWNFKLSDFLWIGGIRQVNHPKWIYYEISHRVEKISSETRREKHFFFHNFHVPQFERFLRILQGISSHTSLAIIGPILGHDTENISI